MYAANGRGPMRDSQVGRARRRSGVLQVDAPSQRTGFTLIELLVVVAIIALLISILLPSLQRARAQARQVICNTHLMSMGKTSRLYAADNKDFIPRGIQGFGANEYQIFATALIKYFGYTGDSTKLFVGNQDGVKHREWVMDLVRQIPQYQCPDFPDEASAEIDNSGGKWIPRWGTCPFDYDVSAFAIPYTRDSITHDTDLQWVPGGGNYQGEAPGPHYVGASKLEDFPPGTSPSGFIYVTEVHKYMPWDPRRIGLRFFTCFYASQLPFAGKPRIANDQRHPAGINALFFDSHAQTMELHQMDPGFPQVLSKRLRWFTILPDDYVEPG
jgi:prepilin-type N-terminal cleavage/methylation domain-containing protein/prepilin-type processing-associated H-X9-DG protein